jgi:hypothetical protein
MQAHTQLWVLSLALPSFVTQTVPQKQPGCATTLSIDHPQLPRCLPTNLPAHLHQPA